jgi:hypothetical protein
MHPEHGHGFLPRPEPKPLAPETVMIQGSPHWTDLGLGYFRGVARMPSATCAYFSFLDRCLLLAHGHGRLSPTSVFDVSSVTLVHPEHLSRARSNTTQMSKSGQYGATPTCSLLFPWKTRGTRRKLTESAKRTFQRSKTKAAFAKPAGVSSVGYGVSSRREDRSPYKHLRIT